MKLNRAKRETREVRSQKILRAALPLFGLNGFAATTTRELSEAAGVSDALLYKYFPSKAAIYKALIAFCTKGGEDIASRLGSLEPSTESLVKTIYFLVYIVLIGAPEAKKLKPHLDRLLLQSLAGDGSFARGFHESKLIPWFRLLAEKGFEPAMRAGDLLETGESPFNRIGLVYHVVFSALIFRMPKIPAMVYDGTRNQVLDEIVLFSLRGIGLKQEAIDRNFNSERLQEFVRELFASSAPRK